VRTGRETAGPLRLRSGQALHCATPDFQLRLVALANFMRLSYALSKSTSGGGPWVGKVNGRSLGFAPNEKNARRVLWYPTQAKTGLDPDFLPRCAREIRVCAFH
jgi:hypothetical protein